jgi:hypothetical protein
MQIFDIFKNSTVQRSNINSAVNIACKFKCYIPKSKLVLFGCNDLYFNAIAVFAFTLHEIKQRWTPDSVRATRTALILT